ncbi:beta-propeller domain-containing protein [Candidatus Bathyarchaeota archaeon]|nr:beta-propeller domain-containing protein [Candidatus Bathyarchaeota archaeon]MBS7617335.1 beta-propeller domain-containing protein [Candidatus Bathyarchaeota archaeon]
MALVLPIALLLGTSLFLIYFNVGNDILSSNPSTGMQVHMTLTKFSSYEELISFLNRSLSFPWFLGNGDRFVLLPAAGIEAKFTAVSIDYSRTNIQVEGVDEDDVVKTDGEYIYLALGKRVLIVKAYPPDEARFSAEIHVDGVVSGIFVSDRRLIIISNGIYSYVKNMESNSMEKREILFVEPIVSVLIYDVENAEAPILVRNATISGAYFNSRMIEDYVYVLTSFPIHLRDEEPILPEIVDGKRAIRVDPTSIYYSNKSDFCNAFTTIAAINIQNINEPIAYETFLFGYASCIYVSLNNIYVAVPGYSESSGITEIHRIRIEDGKIKYEVSGSVPGLVLNQFSMDEYCGYFRIATTTNTWMGDSPIVSNVYVLNMSLAVIGGVEGLAPGERMYSARFMGDRCYLVTFKKVDPLFVIGLEDPTDPKVLGKLKIPGYSDYLHPYDKNHLIGIGKWTVEAEERDFAWYQGIKISLFDVSDVEHPREIDSIMIGDRGTDSPVLHNHKALLFDRGLNILTMPILLAEIDESKYPNGVPPNTYGDYVWQGLYVFTITEKGISLRGRITHIESPDDFLKSGYWFYSEYAIERALYIGNTLYTISNKMIKMNDLESLEEISSIKLP